MNLKISNLAKIKNADIKIDGITVIAGENNTGKSTVGKVLFSLFNSINDIDKKILAERESEIYDCCWFVIRNYIMHNYKGTGLSHNVHRLANEISEEVSKIFQDEKADRNKVYNIVRSKLYEIASIKVDEVEDMVNEIVNKILQLLDISEYKIILEVITRYFNRVFNEQINSLFDIDNRTGLTLNIKGSNIGLTFNHNECTEFDSGISVMHKAIYIDNPFIVDKLSDGNYIGIIGESTKQLLNSDIGYDIMDGIIGTVLSKEKLDKIYKILEEVVPGDIVEKAGGKYFLSDENCEEPVSFENLSAGLKSFVIIKMLLEKNKIKPKDVLILDEPEIHLHPQWQVVYAEIIVLLQKYFDLSVVVTTHSPYFLDAINLYSIKHGIDSKVNYYLSSVKAVMASMEQVTENIDRIYEKMSTPLDYLDTLRYELNNN